MKFTIQKLLMVILMLPTLVVFNGCEKTELTTVPVNVDYHPIDLGGFHNSSLGYLIRNAPLETASSPEAGMQALMMLYDESITHSGLPLASLKELDDAVTEDELLYYASREFQYAAGDKAYLKTHIDQLANMQLINDREVALMDDMLASLDDVEQLRALTDQWESENFDISKGEGYISGAAISLALNSAEFWLENRALIGEDKGGLAVRVSPVHADVGGFIVGCTLTAIKNWESENVLAESLAGGVMTGVVASSGIAGRIGRWIFG